MKKYLISTISLGIILSTAVIANASNNLTDVDGHWANKEISQFMKNSYVNGYEDGTFKPDNSITRAEFVKLVNKYFGFKDTGASKFSDVNSKDWHYDNVLIANKAGYINGYDDNTFRPNNPITREEAAKIIVSIKNKKDSTYDKINTFKDKHLVSNWAKPYIEGAVENGYLKGDDLKNLRPTSSITRAEAVTLLSRIDTEKDKEDALSSASKKDNENTETAGNTNLETKPNHFVDKSINKEATKLADLGWVKYIVVTFNEGTIKDYDLYVLDDGSYKSISPSKVDDSGKVVKWEIDKLGYDTIKIKSKVSGEEGIYKFTK